MRKEQVQFEEAFRFSSVTVDFRSASVVDLEADEDDTEVYDRQRTPEDEEEESAMMIGDRVRGYEATFDDSSIAAAMEEEEQGRVRRPKRERKRPKLLYNPLEWKDK